MTEVVAQRHGSSTLVFKSQLERQLVAKLLIDTDFVEQRRSNGAFAPLSCAGSCMYCAAAEELTTKMTVSITLANLNL